MRDQECRHISMVVLLITMMLVPSIVWSTPIDDFYDDSFLGKATTQIGKLGSEEIDYFLRYFASCTAPTKSEFQQFNCEKDRTLFQIVYIEQNELRQLIQLLTVTELRIEALNSSRPGTEERKEYSGLFNRHMEILRRLQEAATIYYGLIKSADK